MGRTAKSFLWALAGGTIFLASIFVEIAPTLWWGVPILTASASCYLVAGFVGRGWRAFLGVAVLGIPAALLVIYVESVPRTDTDLVSEDGSGLAYGFAMFLALMPALLIGAGAVARRLMAAVVRNPRTG